MTIFYMLQFTLLISVSDFRTFMQKILFFFWLLYLLLWPCLVSVFLWALQLLSRSFLHCLKIKNFGVILLLNCSLYSLAFLSPLIEVVCLVNCY